MSPHNRKGLFIPFTFLCDSAAIIVSVILAYVVRFGFIPYAGDRPPSLIHYLNVLVVIIPVFTILFRSYGLYATSRYIRRIEEMFVVIKAVSFATVLLLALTFFYRAFSYSRLYLLFLWAFTVISISGSRYFLIQWEYQRKRERREIARVLIVGANRNARHIIQWAQQNLHYGREVIGVLTRDNDLLGKHFEEVPILGSIEEIEKHIEEQEPNEVVLVDPEFDRESISDLVALCEDKFINFKVAADFFGLMTRNVDVEYLSSVPLLGFRSLPLDDPLNRVIKRTFDIIVSAIMLIASSPLWVSIIISIKMTSPGPIFYKQKRMGRDQKLFNVYKFRTMKVDAEDETGPVWAKENDDRRTSIGEFLRRWNLDELPQLYNVFRGDMTLVGPRPERPHFIDQFREDIPRYMARHKIKSGITGWAQVSGLRGNTSIQERLKYDLYYMENWSLTFDIEILLMTLFAFKNAY